MELTLNMTKASEEPSVTHNILRLHDEVELTLPTIHGTVSITLQYNKGKIPNVFADIEQRSV